MEHIERVQRELKYKGAILSMYADTIKVPNGNTAVWDFIGHQGAAAVVPVTDDGKILMVRQYRNSVDRYTLEIPAGGLNSKDEPTIEAAARELEEETGYSCKSMELINEIYPTTGYCDEVIHLYEAKGLFKVENPLEGDEDEFIDVISMPIDEAYKKIMNNEIHDSKTIIAVMKAYNDKYIK